MSIESQPNHFVENIDLSKKRVKCIGITGGIGSGKSTICKVFETFGIPVYYADERAKWLTNNDLQLKKEIKELLGREAYDAHNQYNRKWVAKLVFDNPQLLQMLNMLIHPRVFEDTKQWVKAQSNQPYLLREAALTKAAGNGNDLDKVIVVSAPLDLRINRIKKRDPQRTQKEIEAIISRQRSEEEFQKIADYQIINDEKQLLMPQILAIHQSLLA
ncbi:Dephospho-CoA kinase [Emticicia aquatica]|jgi:dephospho-CoA kinase|uniref:Dephospho-CoA kinase n=1 Tax=Emticicia aquatica TaxID=1681835 RepID=A0ABN8EQK9_9BACT|nr:dephospho-CoA kinase [Emticicia aquatica]CAH0994191.1 Dephospho-CoA kinase [Emticicia aquatica]